VKTIESGCVAIYLNRDCPRRCPYCDVIDPKREQQKLKVNEWKRVFINLENRGMKFFLVLGTEPLMLGNDLVELVKFWKERDYEYGFYTTSPKSYFDKWADKLLDAGLRNWSSGIDFIPEVYKQMRDSGALSNRCFELVDAEWNGLVRKAKDGLSGMEYMHQRFIPEQLILITISRMNIEFVPEMIKYLVDRFETTLKIAMNYVEYSKESLMDFAPSYEKCRDYLLHDGDTDDWKIWNKFRKKIGELPEKYRLRIQNPLDYLYHWGHLVHLDVPGDPRYCALSIECDGTPRLCGYKKLSFDPDVWNALNWDIDDIWNMFYENWEMYVKKCEGCYWAWPHMLKYRGKQVVNFRSDFWKNRDEVFLEFDDVEK